MMRWIKHLFAGNLARRHFPAPTLEAIQHAVAAGEHRHRGEICFAIEGALPWRTLSAGHDPRTRAHEVFSHLRVWDTRENTGVLVYVLLADHAFEIIADRGIATAVDDSQWRAICARMRERFAASEFEAGSVAAITEISDLLAKHFPADGRDNPDELPNRPVIL
jgi:uncharacterized membrane protein